MPLFLRQMDDMKKAETHHGQQLDKLLKYLKGKEGIQQNEFCKDLGIRPSSINYWQNTEGFSTAMWRKLRPVLKKYGLNEDFIKGKSESMKLAEMNEDQRFRSDVLKQLEGIAQLLQEIKGGLQFQPPKEQ